MPARAGTIGPSDIELGQAERGQAVGGGNVQKLGGAAFGRARGHGPAEEDLGQGAALAAKIGQMVETKNAGHEMLGKFTARRQQGDAGRISGGEKVYLAGQGLDARFIVKNSAVKGGRVKDGRDPARHGPDAVVLAGKGPQDMLAPVCIAGHEHPEHLPPGRAEQIIQPQTRIVAQSKSDIPVRFQPDQKFPRRAQGRVCGQAMLAAAVAAESRAIHIRHVHGRGVATAGPLHKR